MTRNNRRWSAGPGILRALRGLVALVLGIICAAAPASAKVGGPKTFNLYLRNYFEAQDTTRLANWDALGLDADTPHPVLNRLKQLNPSIKLLAYIPINGTYANANVFAPNSKWREMWEAANANNWWLRNTQGGIVYDHPGKYTLNLTENCPQNAQGQTVWDWYPQWIADSILENGNAPWDGVILDDVWTAIWFVGVDSGLNEYQIDSDRDGLADDQPTLDDLWEAGNDTISARVRRLMPSGEILAGNGQNTFHHMNGSFIEAFPYKGPLDPGSRVPGYAWNDKMFGPVGYFANENNMSGSPQRMNVNNAKWTDGDRWTPDRTPEFQRHKRFTLTSTMLRDGYFAISWQQATQGHNSIWWEPEYDKMIGTPTGAPFQATYNGTTLWRRNYTNGVVLINPGNSTFLGSKADGIPPIGWVDGAVLLSNELWAPESVPPATIHDLTVSRTWPNQIEVQWTNVGDNGTDGQAVAVSVRYSTSPINDGNWASATEAVAALLPEAPGTTQKHIVTGLASGGTYYFAVKTKDLADNWAACSNSPAGLTELGDITAPFAVSNLAVTYTTSTNANVTWTATGDDGGNGTAAAFDLRYATFPLNESNWGSGAQVIGEPAPGPAGTNHSLLLYGMTPNTTYYFGIKVCDEMPNCSGLSNIPSAATLAGDQTPPAALTDLRVTAAGSNWFIVSWTAPGDDDLTGRATSYDARWAVFPITSANFNGTNYANYEPGPQTAGTTQFYKYDGMGVGFNYYAAIKTKDEVPNSSGISNVVYASTGAATPLDVTPPGAVTNLAVTGTTANTASLSWTAPGDDGTGGTATAYEVRYATSPITAATFNVATPVFGEPIPGAPGTTSTCTVTGLASGTTYHFTVKTADEQGNWSAVSNSPSATPGNAPPPDTTPPAAVTNLAVGSATPVSLTLNWTAPGDDGATGTATQYDLRRSTAPITAANFASATSVAGVPAPAAAGTAQSMVVSGLNSGTTYHFALKAADEVSNWSGLSNAPSGATAPPPGDTTPPAAVANLAVTNTTGNSVTLSWTAPGDDGTTGTAALYDMRYATVTITAASFDGAGFVTTEPTPTAAGTTQSLTVSGLGAGSTYFFALKTRDEANNWSTISNTVSATTPTPDTTPPAAVSLALGSATLTGMTVSWTAPGDDGNAGTASQYDLRYSTGVITAANFAAAAAVTGEPTPAAAGTPQSVTVTGLASGTTYHFALKSGDEVPNWSTLSNVPALATLSPPDVTPPSAVTNLTVGSATPTTLNLTWTAPGDDGASVGTAAQYDIRISANPITAANFTAATPVGGAPTPTAHGTGQSLTITGLAPGSTRYFAMKSADEVPNWSTVSNVASGTTTNPPPPPPADTTPPAAVTTLAVGTPTTGSLTVSWNAPGDDGASGVAASYDLRWSTGPITAANFAAATAVAGEPAPAAAGTAQSVVATGLPAGTTCYFALKSADEVPNWSTLSNVASGSTATPPPPPPADTTPPAAVTDLNVALVAALTAGGGVELRWTAPGDDGASGIAAAYDVRWSTTLLNAAGFALAHQVSTEPTPGTAGSTQTLFVDGLPDGTTCWFAVKASDEAGNVSGLSNVVSIALPAAGDVTPPAAVANLVVYAPTASGFTVSWTAPGDDAMTGTAAQYDLRHAASPISAATFNAATPVVGEPAPQVAGSGQSMTVTGLNSATTYHLAIRTVDESGNWSSLSNVTSGTTTAAPPPPDTTPPAAITSLTAPAATTNSVTLNWRAPGDDNQVGRATSFDVRYATSLLTAANFDQATPVTGEPIPGNSGSSQSMVVGGLEPGTTYHFALRTSDEAGNSSGLSNVVSRATPLPPDTTPPAAVTDLSVESITRTSLTLAWHAPGDDGPVGAAQQYDLRYSRNPITVSNFGIASSATGEPLPQVAGSAQSFTLPALEAGTTYYLALKTGDEAGNWSAMSNLVEGVTEAPPPPPDVTAPASVTDLALVASRENALTVSWTAPADAPGGMVASYDIRYATTPLTAATFPGALPLSAPPAPAPPGTLQTAALTGLAPGTTYHVALRSQDGAGNISGLSNVLTATTPVPPPPPDTVPPAAVTALRVVSATTTTLTVSWSAPGGDANSGRAAGYDLRYDLGEPGVILFEGAIEVIGEPTPATAGSIESLTLTGLAPGTSYDLALKSVDDVGNVSELSNVATGRTEVEPPPPPPADTTPPAVVSLALDAAGTHWLEIGWTAPGDDGDSGTATLYELRHSPTPLDGATWNDATPVGGLPTPGSAGTTQGTRIEGLTPSTTYHLALRARDEAGNWSEIGPVMVAVTSEEVIDTAPPLSPVGLTLAVEGTDVSLVWQPNLESDLGGYRVYRRVNGEAWQPRTPGLLTTPSFIDPAVPREVDIDYSVTAVNRSGQESTQSLLVSVRLAPEPPPPPRELALASAAPNPFLGALDIRLAVPATGVSEVLVLIYDIRGRALRTLHQGPLAGGEQRLEWDGTDDDGEPAPAGVYFVVLRGEGAVERQKVVRTR